MILVNCITDRFSPAYSAQLAWVVRAPMPRVRRRGGHLKAEGSEESGSQSYVPPGRTTARSRRRSISCAARLPTRHSRQIRRPLFPKEDNCWRTRTILNCGLLPSNCALGQFELLHGILGARPKAQIRPLEHSGRFLGGWLEPV
jgi:hypothetical protein